MLGYSDAVLLVLLSFLVFLAVTGIVEFLLWLEFDRKRKKKHGKDD